MMLVFGKSVQKWGGMKGTEIILPSSWELGVLRAQVAALGAGALDDRPACTFFGCSGPWTLQYRLALGELLVSRPNPQV